MDYTKVLSKIEHAKDALAKKLDSIKSDVTNVNNSVTNLPTTLDSKFSALTAKVDGVKTDVAGVGGKVDTVGSTLNKVNQSVVRLEDDVNAMRLLPEETRPVKYFERKSVAYETGKKLYLKLMDRVKL